MEAIFPYVTIGWIALCGLVQTIRVLVILSNGNESFRHLPVFIRYFVLIAAPVLLAPFIVNMFIAYKCYKGISDADLSKLKNIVASLKVGKIIIESIPQ